LEGGMKNDGALYLRVSTAGLFTLSSLSTDFAIMATRRFRGRRGDEKVMYVKIGDVVKICEEGVRRGDWPIGRVFDVFPGQDGVVRMAKVRTHGYLVRPVAKLVVIVLGKGTESYIYW
jgi:hypothetical protein